MLFVFVVLFFLYFVQLITQNPHLITLQNPLQFLHDLRFISQALVSLQFRERSHSFNSKLVILIRFKVNQQDYF
jgi:hypothetical protein